RALLVEVDFGAGRSADRLVELEDLVRSAGADIAGVVTARRARADPALFAGRGKVDQIAVQRAASGADLVIFDHALSGAQQRNLERALDCRVVDRVSLILDIFALRAQSAEGKLQVELAQLQHLSTRLVRGWTHLERQAGGVGLRGPGETQLETDRRLIGMRVKMLKSRLQRIAGQRETQRRARRRAAVKNVALVGYTNAGKSTLFNRLTGAASYTADRLFATLDTTLRRLVLPGAEAIVVSDTVGFVRDLPHDLIAAFRATLKEAVDADLLLHVVDNAHSDRDGQIAAVDVVLAEIGAESVPQILVRNKCDRGGCEPGVERDEYGKIRAVRLSALTGAGVEGLRAALVERFPRPGDRAATA
ncbi:MAG TPA: GTPase HflX, partial [Casimicrobiaceae bacterium]|nr:GTPase HflX [Casimicrobiaceae bacterium]